MTGRNNKATQIWLRIIPQVILVFLLSTHLWIGAHIFRFLDPKLAELQFFDVVFFEFVTISTIGYGNVLPSTDSAKLFTILFSIIGIPLLLVTLANFGKYLTKFWWKIVACINPREKKTGLALDTDMPILILAFLFFATMMVGIITIPHNGQAFSVDDIYFSFISFATVGFGDKVPTIPSISSFLHVLFYLAWGIMLTTILFNVGNNYLNRVYYLGRRFKGTRDVEVFMGAQCITVSEITSLVAQQFHASPREVRSMLQELDGMMEYAVMKQSTASQEQIQDI